MSAETTIRVTVVFAEAGNAQRVNLERPHGITARHAVTVALEHGLVLTAVDAASAALGIYSERVEDDYVLQDGDRLEIYRPLAQDPMELRRQRAKQSTLRR